MPYRSKVDRERPLWMTLGEALAHIQAHLVQGSCDQLSAETELRMACGEGEIPLRWAADPPPQGLCFFESFGLHSLFAADEVPTSPLYWRQVLIFGDRVVDQSFSSLTEADSPPERAPRQRELFLLRSRVLELWPLRSDAHEGASAKGRPVLVHRDGVERIWPTANETAEPRLPTADLTHDAEPLSRPSGGRRNYSEAEIRKVARQIYADPAYNRPNENQVWDIMRTKLPGLRGRVLMRQVIKEPEFKSQRRLPGKQPKL